MLAIADLVTSFSPSLTTEEVTFDIDAVVAFHVYRDTPAAPSETAVTTLHLNTQEDLHIDYAYTDFKARFLKYKKGQIEDGDFVGKIDPTDNVEATDNPPITGVIRMYYLTAPGAINP